MSKFRLFIGNLSPGIKEGELRSKFESLLSSHPEAQVGQVEVRVKNDDNFFGFVNVHVAGGGGDGRPPPYLLKSIDLMNNTKWKGSLIKVQLAKESFLDKLKRERDGGHGGGDDEGQGQERQDERGEGNGREAFVPRRNGFQERSSNNQNNSWNDNYNRNNNRKVFKDDFDFEIVSNNHLDKKNDAEGMQEDDEDDEEDEEETSGGIKKFKGLLLSYPKGLPEIPIFPEPKDRNSLADPGTTEAGEQVDEQGNDGGIQIDETMSRLQRIAGYSAAPIRPAATPPNRRNENNRNAANNATKSTSNHVQKFGFDPFPKPVLPVKPKLVIPPQIIPHDVTAPKQTPVQQEPPPKMGIVLNKRKQQASELLREQSLAKRSHVQSQKSSIIKSSLASSLVVSQPSETKPTNKLFEGDEDEDDEDTFAVKGQFEGTHGQHLLALKGQWGNDSRFKIDSRFEEDLPEESNKEDVSIAQERNAQLSILNDLLGTQILQDPSKKTNSAGSKKSIGKDVIIKRYDPDAPDDDEEQEEEEDKKKPSEVTSKVSKTKESKEETSAGTIRASEPASYKTASNLKSLFTSSDVNEEKQSETAPSTFSLLATFGQSNPNSKISSQSAEATIITSKSSGPRQFWETNPFKYDSSDDEDDESTKKKSSKTPTQTVLKISPTDSFFFTKKDKRFEGLVEYFLDSTPDERIDFDEKRKELRSIVKAKARNAKRKDEKRTLAIKRAIRKKKKYQKSIIKKNSSNAVKLGG